MEQVEDPFGGLGVLGMFAGVEFALIVSVLVPIESGLALDFLQGEEEGSPWELARPQ